MTLDYRRRVDDLILAAKNLGHFAHEVSDPRFHVVNVWLDTNVGMLPSATVTVDDDGYAWGHSWEHHLPPDAPATVVIDTIKETTE